MTAVTPPFAKVTDYVTWFAERTPDADALVLGSRRITYREMGQEVEALARALVAAGVGPGDRVATLSTPHPDSFIALLATISIGALWVGLNPRYRSSELREVMQDCKPKVLLTRTQIEDRHYHSEIDLLQKAVLSLERTVCLGSDPVIAGTESYQAFLDRGTTAQDGKLAAFRAKCKSTDPCIVVYTSGSSGRPKGAVLSHSALARFGEAQNRVWPLSRTTLLNYFPINHVGCVVDISCPALVAGGCIVFLEKFDAATAMRLMGSERVTMWGGVPSVFRMQLALPDFDSYDLSSVELIVWEGAAMPEPMIRRLAQICPRLATNYGLTETTSAVTVVAPTSDLDVLGNTVGEPYEGVEVRLVNPAGELVPDGEPGEIQARSSYNMLRYWERPEDTAATLLPDGWLRTGDLAVRRPDGRYTIVGRLREMYKSGGYNVYPREIENVLEAHPNVALAAVVSVADPLWQEVGIAYVVPRAPVTAGELEAHCRTRLANFKVPKHFCVRRELPLLPIGKVDKVALRGEASAAVEQAEL
jgi:acyl-CoA synthetase (AMP-forming)/AMP-acid ligase II